MSLKNDHSAPGTSSSAGSGVLGCFAHPDDEVFGTGGVFARLAARGLPVHIVCATRGEVGEISDPALATPQTLARVRTDELRCSTRALGIEPPIFLDYRDSGMLGTPENDHPRAFINAPADRVVEELVGLMRKLRPSAVVTFDPKGGYGHPDHVAIHRHAVEAFHAAGDATRFPQAGEPWQPARLFYRVLPVSLLNVMRELLESVGGETNIFDHYQQVGLVCSDADVDLVVDVSDLFEQKWAAFLCHATQFGADHPWQRAPRSLVERLMSRENFILAWPEDQTATDLIGSETIEVDSAEERRK